MHAQLLCTVDLCQRWKTGNTSDTILYDTMLVCPRMLSLPPSWINSFTLHPIIPLNVFHCNATQHCSYIQMIIHVTTVCYYPSSVSYRKLSRLCPSSASLSAWTGTHTHAHARTRMHARISPPTLAHISGTGEELSVYLRKILFSLTLSSLSQH